MIRNKQIYFIALFCLFASNALGAQSTIYDSLYKEINKHPILEEKIEVYQIIVWDYARVDPDISLKLLDDLNQLYKETGTDHEYDIMLYYYGVINKNIGKYSVSESYLKKYEAFVTDSTSIARVNLVLSNLYRLQSKWILAIESAERAIRLFEGYKDTTNQITSLMNIGFSLHNIGRSEEAISYHFQALDLAKLKGSAIHRSIAHSNLGLCYIKLKKIDTAEYHFLASYKINNDNDDVWGLAEDNVNLASLYIEKGLYELGLRYALQAQEQALKIKDPSIIADSKILIGSAQVNLKQFGKAQRELMEVLNDPNLILSPRNNIGVHKGLYIAYKSQEIYDLALKHKEIADSITDEYNSTEVNARVKGLEMRYQTVQKEKEIEVLNLENENAENRIQAFRGQVIGLIVFSVIILGLLFGLYRLYRKSKLQQIAINNNLEEKSILLKEIHHRVKNNLQVISSLLNLQGKHVEDANAKSVLKDGQNRVKSMALIHQRLYQNDNLLGVGVKEYFERLIRNLFNTYNIEEDSIQLILKIEDLQLDVDTLIPLGLIVNELISNALKHAFPSKQDGIIHVTLVENENALFLNVKDNGVGSDRLENISANGSFGFRLIRTFSNQLDAKVEIESNKGTSINIQIHDYKKVG